MYRYKRDYPRGHLATATRPATVRAPVARLTVLLLATLSLPALANPQAGAALAQKGGGAGVIACMTCHGAKGEGQGTFPRLAGQPRAYLEKQLKEFASGKRDNPQMSPIAQALKPDQIANVAEYYASLPEWKSSGAVAQSSDYALGQKLATRGKWSDGVPACFSCHAEGGTGVPPHFPAIAGQPRAYTEAQLKAWQTSGRHNDPQGLMKSVAQKLTAAEISALATYLENPTSPGKDK